MKVALVTGAGSGIGRAAAIELARLGADVTLLARREAALLDVLSTLPADGQQRHGFVCADVADTAALRDSVGELARERPLGEIAPVLGQRYRIQRTVRDAVRGSYDGAMVGFEIGNCLAELAPRGGQAAR